MNERKQQVIKKAHELFINKGFQATSIQDILEYSGISKGTFYNYFSSKNELFKEVFSSLRDKLEEERNKLLIGENLSDLEVFIQQVTLMMKINKKNKLFSLIEEVYVSNDPDLKDFIKRSQYLTISWLYERFLDMFGEDSRPYLLDCAILFMGMLQHTFQYNVLVKGEQLNHTEIIRYCVERLKRIVDDVQEQKVQLLEPSLLSTWLPELMNSENHEIVKMTTLSENLKKSVSEIISDQTTQETCLQLIDFIYEEFLNTKKTRMFLIESALLSLSMNKNLKEREEFVLYKEFLVNKDN
ncbi:TetR/AcrR family transcriptional regulator [Bacillus weihaiensis]|uniref:HTH tetR-type domain-containing protein n=1 Tax=Bacillus weihaiensis TaxID=1547283 RepID=A0A1L3MNL7_9BACI|nr:TetR/AcrR family transcriptional regulator [Bacillus weihaiensis]APH03935.1 hypothetical protein A9C19_03690 [Bacillus weihaiensis]